MAEGHLLLELAYQNGLSVSLRCHRRRTSSWDQAQSTRHKAYHTFEHIEPQCQRRLWTVETRAIPAEEDEAEEEPPFGKLYVDQIWWGQQVYLWRSIGGMPDKTRGQDLSLMSFYCVLRYLSKFPSDLRQRLSRAGWREEDVW